MRFELPDAVTAMNDALTAADDEGGSAEYVGQPLDRLVGEVLPSYDRTLGLNLEPPAEDNRQQVDGLNWGRIGTDVARLGGLAAAVENISGVVRAGRERLAHDWTGEAYDAFRTAMVKIELTLDDYAAAVRTTAAGLASALTGIRTEYRAYRDDTLDTHLNFGELGGRDELTGEERDAVEQKIRNWYRATGRLRSDVDALLAAALENLRIVAEARTFANLAVPGAEPPATRPGTIEIRHDGRTITVAGSGAGGVRVTVGDGTGVPKSYDLDFDAASGPGARRPLRPRDTQAETGYVPAGTNGRCVIEDGPVTVTVERSLFDVSTISVVVQGATGGPAGHTLTLDEQPAGMTIPEQPDGEAGLASAEAGEPAGEAGSALPDPATAGAAGGFRTAGRAGTGWSVHGDLFGSGDPVHSMHGVLVEDDVEPR